MSQLSVANLRIHRGRLLARLGKWPEAERQFELAVASSATPSALYLLGHAQFKCERFSQALENTEQAVALQDDKPQWLIRLGALYERAGRHGDAATAYARALESAPENPQWRARLQRAQAKAAATAAKQSKAAAPADRTTGPRAVESAHIVVKTALAANVPAVRLDVLSREASRHPDDPVLHFQLALAQLSAGQPEEAAASLARARELDPDDVGLVFHHAWALREAGNDREAASQMAEAVRRSPDAAVAKVGAGAYFQQNGLWEQAAGFYEDTLASGKTPSDVEYRAGLAREREYAWDAATRHYYRALIAEPESVGRHLRLGFARERSGDVAGAADAYAAALRLDPETAPKWRSRLGSCLHALRRDQEAVAVLRDLRPNDPSQQWTSRDRHPIPEYEATLHRASLEHAVVAHDVKALSARGLALMEHGLTSEGVRALEAVVRQDSAQDGLNHFRLAMARLAAGDEPRAIASFLDVERFHRPVDFGKHTYFDKPWQAQAMEYVEYREAYPLDEDLVVFESYQGSKIDCNPAAIYRALREDPTYDNLRFAWVVNGRCQVPDDVAQDPRVSLVRRGSALYRRCLGTAGFLVSNVTFQNYFVRRPGQKYLNTWHGTPLKSMGKDITSGFMQHGNVSRNLLQATHVLAPNEHTQDSLISRYEVEGLFTGSVGRLGSPRIDRMLRVGATERARILASLGLDDDGRQIVFYAPTWRGTTGEKHFNRNQLITDLSALGSLDAHVIFRAHHLAERVLGEVAIEGVTVVPAGLDTYDVLGVTDVLVTDYSSIFFDFLGAGKPILFYAYDLEEYLAERGLYFDLEDMPGEVAHTIDELTAGVGRALSHGIADPEGHDQARRAFAPFEDGQATLRAIDFFFGESTEYRVEVQRDPEAPVLFRHDFAPGAATEELLSRAEELCAAGRRVAVLFDRWALANHPERLEQLGRLPDEVQRLVRAGPHVVSLEERWNINQFNRSQRFSGPEQEAIYRRAHRRDVHRALGDAVFSAVVQVSDAEPVGVALLGSTQEEAGRRILVSAATAAAGPKAPVTAPVGWYDAVVPRLADLDLSTV